MSKVIQTDFEIPHMSRRDDLKSFNFGKENFKFRINLLPFINLVM